MLPAGHRRSQSKKGCDQRYEQVYLTALYDQSQAHRLVGLTSKDPKGLGRRRREADERVGLADGAVCLRRHRQRGGKRKLANRLPNYAAERQAMIRYDECDKRGWDVGSGPMESMCGVTTDRIKGRGRRWDLDNAESVMALEALYQSHQWDQYWARALSHWN